MGNTKAIVTSGGGSGAAASIAVGNPVSGGVANGVLYEDGSQNLKAEAAFTYVEGTDTLTAVNAVHSGLVQLSDGTKAAPVLVRSSATTTGLYFGAAFFGFGTGGVSKWILQSSTGATIASDMQFAFGSTTDVQGAASDTGLARAAAGVIRTSDSGAGRGWIQQTAGELALNANYTNATAGFTNTALSATVISGRTYSFTCCLFFDDSTAADGAQFDFNGGSAAATNFRAHATAANATGAALVLTNANSVALATAIQVALALTTQACITIQGTFVPSGAGTFIVRAAQTAHSAGTLTVDRGSWLNIRDANPL